MKVVLGIRAFLLMCSQRKQVPRRFHGEQVRRVRQSLFERQRQQFLQRIRQSLRRCQRHESLHDLSPENHRRLRPVSQPPERESLRSRLHLEPVWQVWQSVFPDEHQQPMQPIRKPLLADQPEQSLCCTGPDPVRRRLLKKLPNEIARQDQKS